jgi:hypothetical protein
VRSRSGEKQVSVVVYPLLKPYRPDLFAAAAKELDRVASQLAAKDGQAVSKRETTTVDGRKVRAYRFGTTRIGFVLVGKREYELLCELRPDGSDTDGACALLFASFSAP